MRRYNVTSDTSEKEKIIGGLLDMGQGAWLILGFILIMAVFLLLKDVLPPILALIIALIPGCGIGLPFAFYKKEGLTLLQLILYKHRFASQTKFLVNDLNYKDGVL